VICPRSNISPEEKSGVHRLADLLISITLTYFVKLQVKIAYCVIMYLNNSQWEYPLEGERKWWENEQ